MGKTRVFKDKDILPCFCLERRLPPELAAVVFWYICTNDVPGQIFGLRREGSKVFHPKGTILYRF